MPSAGLLFKQHCVRREERGKSVGSSITVGVPFKGLKAKHLIAKHCTIYSSNTHQLVCPAGLLKFLRGCICHMAVNATRGGDEALPTPGISKAFICSPHRLGQKFESGFCRS